jgi:hypothetical protein
VIPKAERKWWQVIREDYRRRQQVAYIINADFNLLKKKPRCRFLHTCVRFSHKYVYFLQNESYQIKTIICEPNLANIFYQNAKKRLKIIAKKIVLLENIGKIFTKM